MREFASPRGALASLAPGTRVACSAFLVFCLAGYVVMVALGLSRSGFTPASIADYYAGGPDAYAKTTGELLEVTHFHLFSMPLLILVQGHLFLMTRGRSRWKGALVLAAFLGAALDIGAPWLVVHVARELAWVKLAARVLLAPSLLAFAVVPLVDMWRPSRRA